jgi:hypothetical protein
MRLESLVGQFKISSLVSIINHLHQSHARHMKQEVIRIATYLTIIVSCEALFAISQFPSNWKESFNSFGSWHPMFITRWFGIDLTTLLSPLIPMDEILAPFT